MQHLDEGLVMAWLDGELTAAEVREAEAHLRACPECAARLEELKSLMGEAEGLVQALDDSSIGSPAGEARRFAGVRKFSHSRNLAWAAGIIAAVGLGAAGTIVISSNQPQAYETAIETPAANRSVAPPTPQEAMRQEPAPSAAPDVGSGVAAGTIGGAIASRSREAAEERRPPESAGNLAAADQVSPAQNSFTPPLPLNPPRDEVTTSFALRDTARRADIAAKAAEAERDIGLQAPRFQEAAPPVARLAEPFTVPIYQQISMEEAVRQLSGAIRLIDGLTPEEFQIATPSNPARIRVVYRLGSDEVPLYLDQVRVANSALANDLQSRSGAMNRVGSGNQLVWNDLQGFHLTLTGVFSADSLSHFKTMVK